LPRSRRGNSPREQITGLEDSQAQPSGATGWRASRRCARRAA
jgi:hypothetical protein